MDQTSNVLGDICYDGVGILVALRGNVDDPMLLPLSAAFGQETADRIRPALEETFREQPNALRSLVGYGENYRLVDPALKF